MVFFTSILIVVIFYYLQADGLIYVTIIAVVAELINIFMTHTLTKSVEKKTASGFGKIIDGYKIKMAAQKKTIGELENVQEESIQKMYHLNLKISEYEEKLGIKEKEPLLPSLSLETPPPVKEELPEKKPAKEFIDLPSGSNRKKLPF